MGFRGDGNVVEEWHKKVNLETLVSRFYVQWLRVKHEDSIKLSFEIPIVFANNRKGAKHIFIDHEHLSYYLNLH